MRCHPKDGGTDLASNASDQDSDLREIHKINDIVMVVNYSQSYQCIPPFISKLYKLRKVILRDYIGRGEVSSKKKG